MRKYLLLVLLSLITLPALAQRTAEGENFLQIGYTTLFSDSWGFNASYGRYFIPGFWEAGVTGTSSSYSLAVPVEDEAGAVIAEDPTRLTFSRYTARGGIMMRLVATRNRQLCLYAGGGALVGAGLMNTSESAAAAISEAAGVAYQTSTAYFLYGLYPKVEAEFFFAPTVALVGSVSCPVVFTAKNYAPLNMLSGGYFKPEAAILIRINF